VVGDIDQELEVVQKVSAEKGVNLYNKDDLPKGVPEPKVEGVGLGTECRNAELLTA